MSTPRPWLEAHKPRASRQTQLLMAQLLWTLVGTMLFSLGLHWIVHRYGAPGYLYALPFLGLGLAKGVLILDRVAFGAVGRVASRPLDRCAGGFFSTRSWLLVLGMMLAGQLLRASPLPRADIGFLYVAVGSGLVFSSRIIWRVWWTCRHPRTIPAR